VLQIVDEMEAREASLREVAREAQARRIQNEAAVRAQRERQEFEEGRLYLLRMFDGLTAMPNHQSRGYLLQDVLNKMFDLHSIPVVRPFTRNDGAEQIDGGFKLDGWHYLVGCRWREKLADGRDLDGLAGQVRRSGKQTMGLFLSVEGWSNNVVPVLKQNPDKSIILMHGYDVHAVLSGEVDLRDFILAKAAILSFESEPFLGVSDYTSRTNDGSLPKLAPAGSPAF
jgi:hypothetical protein